MRLVPMRPSAVPATAGAAAGLVRDAVATTLAVPGRVAALLSGVEALVERVGRVVDEVERTAARAAGTVEQAATVAAESGTVLRQAATVAVEAEEVTRGAAGTLAGAAELSAAAGTLLAQYEGPLLALRPTVERLAEATDPREVEALVALVDRLPVLLDSMDRGVLPLLSQLNVMAPDLHSLLEAVEDMRSTVAGIPGFGRLLRRGEEELADRHG